MAEHPDLPSIRVSDDERERAISQLRDAVTAGRLTLEEFSDRVGQAQVARTDHELAELTADLPSLPVPAPAAPAGHRAICSRLERSGAWELPARSTWRSIFGTIWLDLRQVRLDSADVELNLHNLFGTITILVPAGVIVEVSGGGPFASQVIEPPARRPPRGAPRLKIHAAGPGGTLYVRSPDSDMSRRPLTRGRL